MVVASLLARAGAVKPAKDGARRRVICYILPVVAKADPKERIAA
jgi:hypothetical protein